MASKKDASRSAKLAAALKDNLKRRKAQAKARGAVPSKGLMVRSAPGTGEPRTIGTAPQAGLEDQPQKGPKTAKNPK